LKKQKEGDERLRYFEILCFAGKKGTIALKTNERKKREKMKGLYNHIGQKDRDK